MLNCSTVLSSLYSECKDYHVMAAAASHTVFHVHNRSLRAMVNTCIYSEHDE
jgi:hypothetical protein